MRHTIKELLIEYENDLEKLDEVIESIERKKVDIEA